MLYLQDRDETKMLNPQDQDETETFNLRERDETRRSKKTSRDRLETETLKTETTSLTIHTATAEASRVYSIIV